ncbi:MAG TPA: APC family permease [Gemmatimonadaceae bacterium]|jgi:amino acid transporter|nr:APC family permease [Gemmatimonadaceae bacterium]
MSEPVRREASLARAVGLWGLAASIVNITVGGGIFRIPSHPDVAGRLGAAAPVAYVVAAVAIGLVVLCVAEAGSRVSLTGGPYAYVEAAFGPYVGFLTGALLWVIGASAMPAISMIFADNVARLVPALDSHVGRIVLLAVTYAVIAWINVRGVRQGNRLNAAATVVKLAPLALLIAAGVFAVRGENLRWTSPPQGHDVLRAAMVLVFAFAGLESALVPSGEVKDSSRTVPRALFVAMGTITLLYILLQVVAQGVLGGRLVGSATPLADAAGVVLGGWGAALFSVAVVLSTFGFMCGMALAIPRALFALSRDGYLPAVLSRVHAKYQTPHVAIVVQAALTVLLAATNGFDRLVVVANVAVLLVYLGCSAGAWELRRRNVRADGEPFRAPGGAVVPAAACLLVLGLLSTITAAEWRVFGVVFIASSIVYLATRRARAARTVAA